MNGRTAAITITIDSVQRVYRIPMLFYKKLSEIRPPYFKTNNMFIVKILFEKMGDRPLDKIEDILKSDLITPSDLITCLIYDFIKENNIKIFDNE